MLSAFFGIDVLTIECYNFIAKRKELWDVKCFIDD